MRKRSPAAAAAHTVAAALKDCEAAWHSASHMLNKEAEVLAAQAAAGASPAQVRHARQSNRPLGLRGRPRMRRRVVAGILHASRGHRMSRRSISPFVMLQPRGPLAGRLHDWPGRHSMRRVAVLFWDSTWDVSAFRLTSCNAKVTRAAVCVVGKPGRRSRDCGSVRCSDEVRGYLFRRSPWRRTAAAPSAWSRSLGGTPSPPAAITSARESPQRLCALPMSSSSPDSLKLATACCRRLDTRLAQHGPEPEMTCHASLSHFAFPSG